ncbi:peroxiredoxin [Dysgonomonas sp. 25]|uniref:peroxiredoxin family protein n=1 Tax=Dysgonomonas sp. 25 TaxID=2302933 RepID=UPI0013D2236B|nr:redoxin domain-containing protein [Dysgonomonas sp. 25]NDV68590.1 hypothetical protein [Dysgonomonas sp. 25]
MKKVLLIIFALCLVGVMILLVVKIQEKKNDMMLTESVVEKVPQIEVYNLKNEVVKLNDICTGNTIIVYFNTTCEICHIEIKEFYRLRGELNDSQVIFISNNTNEEIGEFIASYNLDDSQFQFLRDKNYSFITSYDIPTTPFTLLYVDGELYKTYKGAVRVEQIIKDKNDRKS